LRSREESSRRECDGEDEGERFTSAREVSLKEAVIVRYESGLRSSGPSISSIGFGLIGSTSGPLGKLKGPV
jgi:hypothetical protein